MLCAPKVRHFGDTFWLLGKMMWRSEKFCLHADKFPQHLLGKINVQPISFGALTNVGRRRKNSAKMQLNNVEYP